MLFDGQVIDFVINLIVDSFRNTLSAFIWPVHIVQFSPPWGAIGLGLAFAGFSMFLQKPIEKWLADEESK